MGAAALESFRIASGIPGYGQDIRERDLPQETEQRRALNFSKGCYVGQEIVERIRSRGNEHRTFTGFVVDGALPALGSKIQLDGKDVGRDYQRGFPSRWPRGERMVALGYVRREAASPGKQLTAEGAKLTVTSVPFAEVFFALRGITMAEKKQENFIVNDRRLFTADGELRQEASEEQVSVSSPDPEPTPAATPIPAPPTSR